MKKNILQFLVVIICFVLFAHFIPFIFTYPDKKARIHATESSLASIRGALGEVKEKYDRYPTEAEGLDAMRCLNVLGLDQFRMGGLPTDSWGTQFRYRVINGEPVVDSAGKDGMFDTKDDFK